MAAKKLKKNIRRIGQLFSTQPSYVLKPKYILNKVHKFFSKQRFKPLITNFEHSAKKID
jgi:hypothetical protein